jgi:hypothetical protein
MTDRGRPRSSVPLVSVVHAYVLEAAPDLSPSAIAEMDELIVNCITGAIDHATAIERSTQLTGSSKPMEKLRAILTVTDQPLRSSMVPQATIPNGPIRKKNELWSEYEDIRLLAGIHRFGIGNWGSIARFIGNNRTKAQSCQRWCRGIDPRISKTSWTPQEDEKLRAMVERFGQKAWTRIAMEFGNRCDVQCRYRFNQLQQVPSERELTVPDGEDRGEAPPVTQVQRRRARTLLPSINSLIEESSARPDTRLQSLGIPALMSVEDRFPI